MRSVVVLILIVAFIFGCATSTQITGSWKNPKETPVPVQSILITALTSRTNARQTIENDLANIFQQRGVKAVKSFDIMPPTFTEGKEPDKEALLKKIKGSDVDAILTVALINKETENRYVPGSYSYAPMTRFGYYGRFGGYYTTWYPRLIAPGYYTEENTYFLETNLYDAKTEELLWSAQSETYDPGSLTMFSKEFADLVIERMKKDNVLM